MIDNESINLSKLSDFDKFIDTIKLDEIKDFIKYFSYYQVNTNYDYQYNESYLNNSIEDFTLFVMNYQKKKKIIKSSIKQLKNNNIYYSGFLDFEFDNLWKIQNPWIKRKGLKIKKDGAIDRISQKNIYVKITDKNILLEEFAVLKIDDNFVGDLRNRILKILKIRETYEK